jgi:hypothetical protein
VARLRDGLRARQQRLDAITLVGGDAVLQEIRVDPEPLREPFDRLARRARLTALDLAHVLLAETRARDVRLRQACGNAKLAKPLAETIWRERAGGVDTEEFGI